MKIIAVVTDNFRFYYDIVKELKQRDIPFISISPKDPVPEDVEVVITTERERDAVDFKNVVAVSQDIRKGVRRALSILSGKASYQQMIVGVDPGSKPGVALVGDGQVLETTYADSPEDVKNIVERYMNGYEYQNILVRIGHGDRTNRNRTIGVLRELPVIMEIVNEERTTKGGISPDLEAAKQIAMSIGELVVGEYAIESTVGEQREMQRRSRIKSEGEITISRDLAKKVVEGELNLKEAIVLQKKKSSDG